MVLGLCPNLGDTLRASPNETWLAGKSRRYMGIWIEHQSCVKLAMSIYLFIYIHMHVSVCFHHAELGSFGIVPPTSNHSSRCGAVIIIYPSIYSKVSGNGTACAQKKPNKYSWLRGSMLHWFDYIAFFKCLTYRHGQNPMTMRLHSGICSGFMTRIIQAHHVNLDELLRHQRISTIVRANEPAGVMCLPTVAVQKPFPTPKALKHLVGWFFFDTLANIYIYILLWSTGIIIPHMDIQSAWNH